MLAEHRRHDGLVVDAGVGHQDAERLERGDRAPLQFDHPGLLLEPVRGGEIGAARIGDGRDAHPPLLRRQARHALQPFDAGDPSDSVSAMMWAWLTGTKSSAPR